MVDRKISTFGTLFPLMLLAGCAATGKPYSQFINEWQPLDIENARVVFYKPPKKTPFGVLSTASFSVNDEVKGVVMWGGFNLIDLKPGITRLSVAQTGGLGSCRTTVSLNAGQEYFFRIDLHHGQAVATALLGLVGAAVDSLANECGGAYKFEEIDSAAARIELSNLRLTR